MPLVFQWFGDEGRRAASPALPPQRPSAGRLPEEDQAVHSGERRLLEEEAAAQSLRHPEDASPSAGRELQVDPGRHLLGAAVAQPRCLLCGEEEPPLLPDQRPGGSAAAAELQRGGRRAQRRREETELQSGAAGPQQPAGERLQRSEHDVHHQRGLFLRRHAGNPEDCCSYSAGLKFTWRRVSAGFKCVKTSH